MKNAIIRDSFKIGDFTVTPVIIWNKYQNIYFSRYLISYKGSNVGYMNDYTKLMKVGYADNFIESVKKGYMELKNSCSLTMLQYN